MPVKIYFHPFPAETVVANLLYNAIRYKKEGGSIRVQLEPVCLSVSNISELPALDREKIFQRFSRHPETKASGNGPGLSIVYQICELASYRPSHQYSDHMHRFSAQF